MRCWCVVVLLLVVRWCRTEDEEYQQPVIYTNQFVVQMKGGQEKAQELARKHGFTYHGKILDDYYVFKLPDMSRLSPNRSFYQHEALSRDPQVQWYEQQVLQRRVKRDSFWREGPKVEFNDPLWPKMWYLNRGDGLDMNVQEAWSEGVTGKGVVVTILDDGLEKDHPDIVHNYDKDASYDVVDSDADPQPRYDESDSNRHGTRCAGEVAATANNNVCSVGVAFDALVGGVRMLDGDVTDVVEAQSLSLNSEHIDIYSASWGPDDDGKTVDGPGRFATAALKEGILKGRGGLGSIFVWASGNGGREHDNCNCDGYTNSMWTLSISSATESGQVPWYSEACSSTLATTYSSGQSGERQIMTTDLHHSCTSSHTGTSASAPLAAGICALALEANKNLTWRDLQHIVVRTARRDNLHAEDWTSNGVGRHVSHHFGYGLMDAGAMVRLAKRWNSVPAQRLCEIVSDRADKLIPAKSHVELSMFVLCEHVRFLEHVQAKITLTASRRGDIHIYITSPAGTRSTLLAQRPIDGSRAGFQSWPFMTVHCWGENPDGTWKLEVHNEGRFYGRASLKEWSMHLYGTTTDPGPPRSKKSPTASDEPTSVPTTSKRPKAVPSTTEMSATTGKSTKKELSLVNVKTRQTAEEGSFTSPGLSPISEDRPLANVKARQIAREEGLKTVRPLSGDRPVVNVQNCQMARGNKLTTLSVKPISDRPMVKVQNCQMTSEKGLTSSIRPISGDRPIVNVGNCQMAKEKGLTSSERPISGDRPIVKVQNCQMAREKGLTLHERPISGDRLMVKTGEKTSTTQAVRSVSEDRPIAIAKTWQAAEKKYLAAPSEEPTSQDQPMIDIGKPQVDDERRFVNQSFMSVSGGSLMISIKTPKIWKQDVLLDGPRRFRPNVTSGHFVHVIDSRILEKEALKTNIAFVLDDTGISIENPPVQDLRITISTNVCLLSRQCDSPCP